MTILGIYLGFMRHVHIFTNKYNNFPQWHLIHYKLCFKVIKYSSYRRRWVKWERIAGGHRGRTAHPWRWSPSWGRLRCRWQCWICYTFHRGDIWKGKRLNWSPGRLKSQDKPSEVDSPVNVVEGFAPGAEDSVLAVLLGVKVSDAEISGADDLGLHEGEEVPLDDEEIVGEEHELILVLNRSKIEFIWEVESWHVWKMAKIKKSNK